MNIAIVVVGKTSMDWLSTGIKEYSDRLSHYAQVEFRIIPPAGNLPASVAMEKEGVAILAKIQPKEKVFVLDEKGDEFTSVKLAGFLEKHMNSGVNSMVFVTGGAYGISDAVKSRADGVISFSNFTFTHQMIRLLLMEQLYRAFTIIKGRPYHND